MFANVELYRTLQHHTPQPCRAGVTVGEVNQWLLQSTHTMLCSNTHTHLCLHLSTHAHTHTTHKYLPTYAHIYWHCACLHTKKSTKHTFPSSVLTRYCRERKPLSLVLMDTFEDWLRAFTDDFRRFKRYLETAHSRGKVGTATPCLGDSGRTGEHEHYIWGKLGGLGSMNTTSGVKWEDWSEHTVLGERSSIFPSKVHLFSRSWAGGASQALCRGQELKCAVACAVVARSCDLLYTSCCLPHLHTEGICVCIVHLGPLLCLQGGRCVDL